MAKIVQRDAAELSGTPKYFRYFEILCLLSFPVLAFYLGRSAYRPLVAVPLTIPLVLLAGYLGADFISGVVHWTFDTWWSPDTPIIGRTLVRTFREHHVDQKAITRHDFVETNGSNSLAALTLVGAGFALRGSADSLFGSFMAGSLFVASLFTSITSQIHKWSHMARPPRLVQLLQRARLILTKDGHSQHHAAPYTKSYCITCGWMNPTLNFLRFFAILERVISAVTGAIPRVDDIGKEAAIALAAENEKQEPRVSEKKA
jgi:ubiquitin-conjugating enzyme E2 variant